MGVCFTRVNRKNSAPTSCLGVYHDLDSLKESFVYQIFRLHNLSLQCRAQVENLLIKGKKFQAFVIKSKDIVIKKKLQELRIFIKGVDELCFSKEIEKSVIRAWVREGASLLKDINLGIYLNDILFIADDKTNYCENLQKEFENFEINTEEIYQEIERESLRIQKNQTNNYKRLRFSKQVKPLN